LAGVPYDGKLSKADGKGKWREGLDPQALYAQNHLLSADSKDSKGLHKQWDWAAGAALPSKAYCNQFLKRTIQVIDKYQPELIYFDEHRIAVLSAQ
jgi:alpha-L-fucosidase